MQRRALLSSGFAVAALAAAPGVFAAPADPSSVVVSFHKSVMAAAKANSSEAEAERAVRRSFDLDAIETSVLAGRSSGATAEQRARLGDIIVRRLAARILKDPDVRSGVELVVVKSRPVGDGGWLVSTQSGPRQRGVSLTWRLHDGSQGPRIVDVLHDGGSLASLERHKLDAALHGRDLDAALAELEGSKSKQR
jgi:ABC-type transporter MlaC component